MAAKKNAVNAKVTAKDRTIYVGLTADNYEEGSYDTFVFDTEKEAREDSDFYIKVKVPNFTKKLGKLVGEVNATT